MSARPFINRVRLDHHFVDRNDGEEVPKLLVEQGYRFYFFSRENGEPPHVHVDRDGKSAKFWLGNVACARTRGYTTIELRRIERIIKSNRVSFLRKWNEYFNIGI